MKLSEALRIGIQRRPLQAFGGFIPTPESSCAVGAILDGYCFSIGKSIGIEQEIDIRNKIPDLVKPVPSDIAKILNDGTTYSYSGGPQLNYWGLIVQLNDHKHWTRERIAEWLEGMGE